MDKDEIQRIKDAIEALAIIVKDTHAMGSAYIDKQIHTILYHPKKKDN